MPEGAATPTPDPRAHGDDAHDLEGIDVDILPDGTVRLHAKCQPGQDPAECAARIQFLVDALGLPSEGVVTEVSESESQQGT